jgi:hypothetical protein
MIREVSETLVDVLHQATPDAGTWVVVSSLSAADPEPAVNRLALSLYAVEEHPHLRNRPLRSSSTGYVRPPLALRLRYLMTYNGTHAEAQSRLARVIAVLHTTPIIGRPMMPTALADQVETITVRLTSPSADERNQIWSALGRSARLALFYEVDVAPVDLLAREGVGAVVTHRIDYVDAP